MVGLWHKICITGPRHLYDMAEILPTTIVYECRYVSMCRIRLKRTAWSTSILERSKIPGKSSARIMKYMQYIYSDLRYLVPRDIIDREMFTAVITLSRRHNTSLYDWTIERLVSLFELIRWILIFTIYVFTELFAAIILFTSLFWTTFRIFFIHLAHTWNITWNLGIVKKILIRFICIYEYAGACLDSWIAMSIRSGEESEKCDGIES